MEDFFLLKAGVDTVILTVISATSIDHFGFLEREQEDNADTHIFNIYYICLKSTNYDIVFFCDFGVFHK